MGFRMPVLAALAVLAFTAAGPAAPAPKAASAVTTAALDRLEAEVTAAEDINAIKNLQRLYDHFTGRGLWNDFADLFSDEAHGYYGGGIYLGRESLRQHFFKNLGLNRNGLAEGRIYNHMMFQPVVHLDPGGKTAKARWRILAMLGGITNGNASWTVGLYEQKFIKERGVWRISYAHGRNNLGGSYTRGWSKPSDQPAPGSAPGARSAHPPDIPSDLQGECRGYPNACLVEFHYPNIATAGAAVWTADALPAPAPSKLSNAARLAALQKRVDLLADRQAVERLQNAYGFYIDRGRWDQAADLFDARGTIEVGQMGVYVGPARIKAFLGLTGPQGLREGQLNDHMQVNPIVVVSPDGMTARSYLREIGQTGQVGGTGKWSEGIEDNVYVKVNGVWKIRSLHLFTNSIFDYDKGWGKDAQPAPGPSAVLPPDRPPTVVYAAYPKQVIATFPFPNPGSGKPVEYPTDIIIAPLDPAPKAAPPPVRPVGFADVERRLDRVKDVIELENLQNAYGYYAEQNQWNDVADLMSKDGTYELAQRGVYAGRESIRNFLTKVFGPLGPRANQVADHLIDQPVITVAADGRTAKIRTRLLRFGGTYNVSATWSGGVYENEAVKEDGVWKLSRMHSYNTYTANYDGGWTKALSTNLPGPSTTVPPDRPPSAVFKAFPVIADIPTHYPNPVTGR